MDEPNNFSTRNYKCLLLFLGVVHDKETDGKTKSLFTHNNGMSSNSYYDQDFRPEFDELPEIPMNV